MSQFQTRILYSMREGVGQCLENGQKCAQVMDNRHEMSFCVFCILISKYNRVKTFGHEIKWSIMLYCS